jgi:predicted phosphohydrolase
MPTVTYISDIHLEFYKQPIPYEVVMNWGGGNNNCDILCLAGDIGYPELVSYQTFLAYCSSVFKYVFVIAGNHEYYQTSTHYMKTIFNTNDKIKEICECFRNVHFLCESSYYIPEYNITVLGTTLWSDAYDEDHGYNDFSRIYNMSLHGYMQRLHEMSVCFLETELDKLKNNAEKSEVLVITHHMPSFQLISPKYKESDIKHLFATNLERFFDKKNNYNIKHWICGHSHTPVQKTIGTTQIWMNPIGYPGENRDVNWTTTFDF